MAKDWRVVIDDTGGPLSGWPSVWSDSEDRSVLHQYGFRQEHWEGPTRKEALEIAKLVAEHMNSGQFSMTKDQELENLRATNKMLVAALWLVLARHHGAFIRLNAHELKYIGDSTHTVDFTPEGNTVLLNCGTRKENT
jgi:hypothetical protein